MKDAESSADSGGTSLGTLVRIGDKASVVFDDCAYFMSRMVPGTVDAIVTDPPYGLKFMGKEFDSLGDGPAQREWHREWLEQAFRVLKPGGFLLAFGGTRTYHHLASAAEDAGFEIRDQIMWLYGSGFPKSLNISKALDKIAGAEREVVGSKHVSRNLDRNGRKGDEAISPIPVKGCDVEITAPATDAARQWDGWGTALKPAHEPCVLARKPLSEKTVAKNVLKHGTGGINVDGCRVENDETIQQSGEVVDIDRGKCADGYDRPNATMFRTGKPKERSGPANKKGRFPANLILTHHPECEFVGTKKVGQGEDVLSKGECAEGIHDGYTRPNKSSYTHKEVGHRKSLGEETVEAWNCHPDCPVRILDEQSGILTSGSIRLNHVRTTSKTKNVYGERSVPPEERAGSKGGASRFFYCAKASRAERNAGLPKGDKNVHPTVKPLALMRYLVRLVCPPEGFMIDPFAGSGTTVIAAVQEGLYALGIENEEDYFDLMTDRVSGLFGEEVTVERGGDED